MKLTNTEKLYFYKMIDKIRNELTELQAIIKKADTVVDDKWK